jgi:hypothetical protein
MGSRKHLRLPSALQITGVAHSGEYLSFLLLFLCSLSELSDVASSTISICKEKLVLPLFVM